MARGWFAALCLLAFVATPARALDFAPCVERGQAGFDCATLPVPIDRNGVVPGTIDIHVERRRGQAPNLPMPVALAGGPGASATDDFDDNEVERHGQVFDAVQLVVFDQRGTGLSGALDCGKLDLDKLRGQRECARGLGRAGAFYRTADSVLDLDAVRAALGAEQLIIFGVSYGTFVAAEYARTFPERVQALVLDSPIGPDGVEALAVTTAHAAGRVLEALCGGGACNGITCDPVGDTASLVSRLARKPLRGRVRLPRNGSKQREDIEHIKVEGHDLLDVLVRGDVDPGLRLLYPASIACPNQCPSDNRLLTLDKTSLIRGVEVSGTIKLAKERWMASVTVRGRDAVPGSLEFRSDGSVTGRLGAQDVATTLPSAAEAAALRRRIPPIGARLLRGSQ